MQHIKDLIKPITKKKGGSERGMWIEQIAHLVDRPVKQIAIITSDWKLSWLRDSIDFATHQKNVQAGWWYWRAKTLTGEDL
ncbi:hypothetical protein LCGC14_1932440 [marine sediment metagenome]|uniref:Uncharacterized protein n=1 Tax=marine sediment metagenome TaxID=412755 RepID=A0A0F9IK72_9ZZZZ